MLGTILREQVLQVLKDGVELILERASALPAIIASKTFEIGNKTTLIADRMGEKMRGLNRRAISKEKRKHRALQNDMDNQS